MSDFYQHESSFETFPRLRPNWVKNIEQPPKASTALPRVALILPALYSELETPAMPRVLEALQDADYISKIILSLDCAQESQFGHAYRLLEQLPMETSILWHGGPHMAEARRSLSSQGIEMPAPGRGRGVWFSMGLALNDPEVEIIAVHDCGVSNYSREMLARLLMPLLHRSFGYRFSKGYYSRFDNQLFGRVTRLFFLPLIASLIDVLGPSGLLTFLGSFRYPLTGEFAASADLANELRIAPHWGLETSMLTDLHGLTSSEEICQVELSENYCHEQQLCGTPDNQDLSKMCTEIAFSLLAALEENGLQLEKSFFRNLTTSYQKQARSRLIPYRASTMMNGLSFDQSREEQQIGLFSLSLAQAWDALTGRRLPTSTLPSWSDIKARLPRFGAQLRAAVTADVPREVSRYRSSFSASFPIETVC